MDGPKGYLWSARLSQKATARGSLARLLNQFFNGSARKLAVHLIEDAKLTEGDIKELRAMLDEHSGR
jgi:predicted transcriptional regulator